METKYLILAKAVEKFCPTIFTNSEFLGTLKCRKSINTPSLIDYYTGEVNTKKSKFSRKQHTYACISKDNLKELLRRHKEYIAKKKVANSRLEQILEILGVILESFDDLPDDFFCEERG